MLPKKNCNCRNNIFSFGSFLLVFLLSHQNVFCRGKGWGSQLGISQSTCAIYLGAKAFPKSLHSNRMEFDNYSSQTSITLLALAVSKYFHYVIENGFLLSTPDKSDHEATCGVTERCWSVLLLHYLWNDGSTSHYLITQQ